MGGGEEVTMEQQNKANPDADVPSGSVVGVVAYALPSNKVASFMQPSLVDHAFGRGIILIPLDLTKPLASQFQDRPFHCIIHKVYDPDWVRQLLEFQSTHPDVIVVDSPHSIQPLQNRISMLDVVSHLPPPPPAPGMGFRIGIPNQQVVFSEENATTSLELQFPVIAKPLESNGSPDSHLLSLVVTPDGLNQLNARTPLVLQEFVNHGSVLFKVYVAGDHVRCVKRPSLPDLNLSQSQFQGAAVLPFSQISNLPSSGGGSSDSTQQLLQEAELPPSDLVHHVARSLRQALNLNLFNFDMIRDTRPNQATPSFLIIDINYFPGYAKVPGFESMLTDFFLDLHSSKPSQD